MIKRVIKFRAWDFEHRKMLVVENLLIEPSGLTEVNGIFMNLDIMQFTGLTDKNGKEIYEHDLIKHDDGTISAVTYDNSLGYWIPFGSGDFALWTTQVEVIGNIYENGDLL